MAKLYNLARMTTPTTSTGTITLGNAVSGFLTFALAGVTDGQVVSYGIRDGANSETGTGTYTSAGTTLTRTVSKSTNADAAISLSGNAQVYITAMKEDIANLREANAFTDATNATSSTTGALTVAGGVGIGLDLFIGDDVAVGGDVTVPAGIVSISTFDETAAYLVAHSTPSSLGGSHSTSNWNATGSSVSALIGSPINNGGSSPVATFPALVLGRDGVSAQAFNNYAEFRIGRYENVSVNSRTRLDIALAHDTPEAAPPIALSFFSSGAVLSPAPTGGLGYGTGAGGTVTQITSRTTGVTINKVCGAITMFTAAGSATAATFTVTNSAVAATDTIHLCQKSGTNLYNFIVTAVTAGTFDITFFTTGGTASDAPVINFVVIKAVTS